MIKRQFLRTTFCLVAPFLMATSVSAETKDTATVPIPYNVLTTDAINVEIGVTNYEVDLFGNSQNNASLETVPQVVEVSPYADLAFATANNYVNVRKKANTDATIVGKLYKGDAATVVSIENDWAKIKSGNVTGYVSVEYLAIGDDAEKLLNEFATHYATVTTQTLKVREKKDVESRCITLIPEGGLYEVISANEDWVKIKVDDHVGFVSSEFVELGYEYSYGVTLEEEALEQARLAAEAAQQQAAQQQAAQSSYSNSSSNSSSSNSSSSNSSSSNSSSSNSSSSSSSSSNSSSSNSSSSSSSLGNRIVNYAKQFVGNPYVWGGTSLTKGADCSGFTQSVYKNFGISIPRTSRTQATAGRKVSVSERQPGDLIFYARNGRINHVAIYMGNNRVVHASNERTGITTSAYNYRAIHSVRRVIN